MLIRTRLGMILALTVIVPQSPCLVGLINGDKSYDCCSSAINDGRYDVT